jgi:hypothetical protein
MMAISITDTQMTAGRTRRTAGLRHFDAGDAWVVSWLPGRLMDRSAAITAMVIADRAGAGAGLSDDPVWPFIESWAAELGLTGARAVVLASPGRIRGPAVNPLVRTGSSANIAFYAERGRPPGYVWAEVLRSDLIVAAGRTLVRKIPEFHLTIYRAGQGEIATARYLPKTRPAGGPLPARTVTAIVRQALKGQP